MRKRNCRGTFPSRGNPMCMILCLTFRRANSMLEMTNNERNVRIVKKLLSAVLCMLTLLTLVGCGQSGAITENSAAKLQTVTQHGVACYRVYGVQYPAVFGEPELTEAELSDLLDGGDPTEMARTVNTVPDALRLLRLRQQNSEDIDDQNAEDTLLRGGNHPYGWVQAMLYLLCGDYEDSGRIDLLAPDDYYAFCAIEQDGLYYAFDPFQIRGNSWISLSGEGYADADVQKVADALRQCDSEVHVLQRNVALVVFFLLGVAVLMQAVDPDKLVQGFLLRLRQSGHRAEIQCDHHVLLLADPHLPGRVASAGLCAP